MASSSSSSSSQRAASSSSAPREAYTVSLDAKDLLDALDKEEMTLKNIKNLLMEELERVQLEETIIRSQIDGIVKNPQSSLPGAEQEDENGESSLRRMLQASLVDTDEQQHD